MSRVWKIGAPVKWEFSLQVCAISTLFRVLGQVWRVHGSQAYACIRKQRWELVGITCSEWRLRQRTMYSCAPAAGGGGTRRKYIRFCCVTHPQWPMTGSVYCRCIWGQPWPRWLSWSWLGLLTCLGGSWLVADVCWPQLWWLPWPGSALWLFHLFFFFWLLHLVAGLALACSQRIGRGTREHAQYYCCFSCLFAKHPLAKHPMAEASVKVGGHRGWWRIRAIFAVYYRKAKK